MIQVPPGAYLHLKKMVTADKDKMIDIIQLEHHTVLMENEGAHHPANEPHIFTRYDSKNYAKGCRTTWL